MSFAKPTSQVVNGIAFSFTSINLTIATPAPVSFQRFVSIDYEHSLEPGELRGQGPMALEITTGNYKTRAGCSMYLTDWHDLRGVLTKMPGKGGFMQRVFQLHVGFGEEGEPAFQDTLNGCRIIRSSRAYRSGNQALMVDLDLYVQEILEGGDHAVTSGSNLLGEVGL